MTRPGMFLVTFTAVATISFTLTRELRENSWGLTRGQQHDLAGDSNTKARLLGQKDSRFFDLLVEFNEENDLQNPICVRDIVRDDLAKNVFKFMSENDLIPSDKKKDFMDDWEVEILSLNQVEVIEELPDEDCGDGGCREAEIPCSERDCDRRLKTTDAKQARKRKWKKKRKKRRYVIRTRTKCSLCYPDNLEAGRKLKNEQQPSSRTIRPNYRIISTNISGQIGTSSLRGTSREIREVLRGTRALGGSGSSSSHGGSGSSDEEEYYKEPMKPDSQRSSQAGTVNSHGVLASLKKPLPSESVGNNNIDSVDDSQHVNEVTSSSEVSKNENLGGENNNADSVGNENTGENERDWDNDEFYIYWKQEYDKLLQRFQERSGKRLKKEIHFGCSESPTKAELFYVDQI